MITNVRCLLFFGSETFLPSERVTVTHLDGKLKYRPVKTYVSYGTPRDNENLKDDYGREGGSGGTFSQQKFFRVKNFLP